MKNNKYYITRLYKLFFSFCVLCFNFYFVYYNEYYSPCKLILLAIGINIYLISYCVIKLLKMNFSIIFHKILCHYDIHCTNQTTYLEYINTNNNWFCIWCGKRWKSFMELQKVRWF